GGAGHWASGRAARGRPQPRPPAQPRIDGHSDQYALDEFWARPAGGLRDRDVLVPVGRAFLARRQVRFLHRRHDRPVPPDRTELDPPPAEPERLQRAARDPDRGEQMPAVTADKGLAAESVAARPGDERSEHIENDQQNEDLAAVPARHRYDGSMRLLRGQRLAEADRRHSGR